MSIKQEQVLTVDPPTELRFRGPFTAQVTSYMKIFNPIGQKVCFKIKTTAPKKYCVRPNCGILLPKTGIEVAVSLQPFEYDPAEKNKHKFMVLSTLCPEEETNLDIIWSNVKPEDTMDSKLKCVFEMPIDNETAANDEIVKEERKHLPETKPAIAKVQADLSPDIYQTMRLEENQLRQENMLLKEEVLRLSRVNQANLSSNNQGAYRQAMLQEPQGRNVTDFAIAFVIALVGIVLGKFFF